MKTLLLLLLPFLCAAQLGTTKQQTVRYLFCQDVKVFDSCIVWQMEDRVVMFNFVNDTCTDITMISTEFDDLYISLTQDALIPFESAIFRTKDYAVYKIVANR